MAMNGIGGNTIQQVKCNMTLREIRQWAAYRNRRGSLNVGRRVEQAAANTAAFHYNTKVKEEHHIDPLVLMPHEDDVFETFEEQVSD